MKKPIALISTDWHIRDDLREDNCEEIVRLIRKKIQTAKSLKIKHLICLGDVFTSRKSQSLKALMTFQTILNMIEKDNDLFFYCIPGNHDKTFYESHDSFLDPFASHNAILLFKNYDIYSSSELENIEFHFLPFFEINSYCEKLVTKNIEKSDSKKILFSHQAVTGSRNNDGGLVSNKLTVSTFKDYDLVLLGHYHDYQEIGKKIFHLPSIRQNNFGEDNLKGFTILYDDLSFEVVDSGFKRFNKIVIDLSIMSKKDVKTAISDAENEAKDSNVRIEFVGDDSKLSEIDVDLLSSKGLDIKKKLVMSDADEIIYDGKMSYDNSDILEAFREFCKENKLDYEENVKFLKL